MDVLIIAGGIPLESSLNGIFEFDQAKALAKKGVSITFFAIDLRSIRRKRKFGIISGELEGIAYHIISFPLGAIPKQMLVWVGRKLLRTLYDRVYSGRKNPDIIHAHFTEIGAIASQLAQSRNVPLVVTEHSSTVADETLQPGFRTVVDMAYGHADALIAVSNPLSRVIRKRFKYENIVVPNVIGGDVFFESIPRKHESFDFVFTGALTERKGIWDLLEAFASFYKAHADSHLHIIGDGTERLSIEKCVKNEKIEKAVTIYGRLNRSEISAVYSKCDCFVLPSRFETFGVVYIEALAAGLPVIGTKCGGPEDIIDESTGLLIECDDISGLINAMEYMYCNSENYNADELKQIVMKRYSESAIAESLIKIYENVLKR